MLKRHNSFDSYFYAFLGYHYQPWHGHAHAKQLLLQINTFWPALSNLYSFPAYSHRNFFSWRNLRAQPIRRQQLREDFLHKNFLVSFLSFLQNFPKDLCSSFLSAYQFTNANFKFSLLLYNLL